MAYSRDGDQLCSNTALIFAFIAVCIGIIPQTTCSFLSINPVEVISMPDVWPPPAWGIADDLPSDINGSDVIDMINNGTINGTVDLADSQFNRGARERVLRKLIGEKVASAFQNPFAFPHETISTSSVLDGLGIPGRNITATNLTVNVGLWYVGSYQIDGKCYPMADLPRAPPPGPMLNAARAMGILASISGFLGFVAAMFNCHADDKTRRKRNRMIAAVYSLAALSTWLIFLMTNISACKGKERVWDSGPLDGLVVLYGRCKCRASCFLTIVAGCCYMISVITVLTYSG